MATTLNGLENQTKVITMNALGEYDNLRPQVKPVEATHAQMVAMREQGKLIPGQLYRITDYVTTVNELTVTNARSAGHPFDIIVMALDATTLSEEAWAIQHDGDEYFANSNLAAWKLRYTLDSINWSKRICTVVEDENEGYTVASLGTVKIDGVSYILWDANAFIDDYGFNRLVSLTMEVGAEMLEYDENTGSIVDGYSTSISSIVGESNENGSGTITYMKDEFDNECPYDFKNIQFKRYMTTDTVSGRTGLDGKYVAADPYDVADGLNVEDESDFIWAFTFSSDALGGEQTDYSLGGHNVHDNTFNKHNDVLPNNVVFGDGNYFNNCEFNTYNNTFDSGFRSNIIASGSYLNSIAKDCYNNLIGDSSYNNSIGAGFHNNIISPSFRWNKIGDNFIYNSIGLDFSSNSIGKSFQYNSIGSGFSSNLIATDFQKNLIGDNFKQNSIASYFWSNSIGLDVTFIQVTSQSVTHVSILNAVNGASGNRLTLNFQTNKNYCQFASMTSAGVLKIWTPADLIS